MSSIAPEVIAVNRGSDIAWPFECKDDNGAPIDMTGWNLELFEAGPAGAASSYVTSNATAVWTDQANGQGEFRLPWDSVAPTEFWFRLRFKNVVAGPDDDDAWDVINVRYK